VFIYQSLPIRVASHFGLDGMADGWMMKGEYALAMVAVAAAWTVIMLLFDFLVYILPVTTLNVPNAAYWKQPENQPTLRRKTSSFLCELGIYVIVLLAFVNYSVLQANKKNPPRLDEYENIAIIIFFVLIALWLVRMFLAFRVPKK
jgi:uncharacterized membrane protein